jgi:hypothetical protein
MMKRFGHERINLLHIGKCLVFFDDAEEDPDPNFTGKDTQLLPYNIGGARAPKAPAWQCPKVPF